MQILQVQIHVLPEHLEAFKQATFENGPNSRQEPGIARFDVLQLADDPTRFLLVEIYRNADAPAKHKETAHYLAWIEKVTPMLAEPRTRLWYTNLDPGDEAF